MLHLPLKHRDGDRLLTRAARKTVVVVLLAAVPAIAATTRTRSPVSDNEESLKHVTAVRFWSLGDVTRIAIEATGEFTFHADRVPNPDRLFFDLPDTKPQLERRGVSVIAVHDRLLRQIRIAETQRGITRVVLDLESPSEFTTETLANPDRLIIELHSPGMTPRKRPADFEDLPAGTTASAEHRSIIERVDAPAGIRAPRTFSPPPPRQATATPVLDEPPAVQPTVTPVSTDRAFAAKLELPYVPPPPARRVVRTDPGSAQHTIAPASTTSIKPLDRATVEADATMTNYRTTPSDLSVPARRMTEGDRSMTRVLGLKVQRIVIDAGHGGHDTGTIGPSGLLEKDLVLDVALRLGALIQSRMGAEVIYTRSDDRFIPLEERTAIANANKADLFLSIHANSSPVRSATGVETYYLNFTTSKDALEVAARENAGSALTVNDLEGVLQKIALKDKVDESREFASRIQTALITGSHSNAHTRDRGVRKAPFVVLIGAAMPSVLAEVGFISNPQDERLLRRPEQRQRIAESLYKGLSQYAGTLSHFQVAEHRAATATPVH